jgi:hypothetical protein
MRGITLPPGQLSALLNHVNRVEDKNLRKKDTMKLAQPLASGKAALKGFEWRLSSILFPLLTVVATLGAILLWP